MFNVVVNSIHQLNIYQNSRNILFCKTMQDYIYSFKHIKHYAIN